MELLQRGRFQVATMPTRLDAMTASDTEKLLLSVVEGEGGWLACDFAPTEYISSAGLRVMLLGAKRARAAGGRLVLFGLRPETLAVFKMAGFDTILEISETLDV